MAKRAAPCVGSPAFDPSTRTKDAEARSKALSLLTKDDDLSGAITTWFQLPANDTWTYHAITAVTLPQVQHIVRLGRANGLHAWYAKQQQQLQPGDNNDASSRPTPANTLDPPPVPDIDDYVRIFQPTSLTSSALKAFGSNAKRGSVRASVAANLSSKRYIHPGAAQQLSVPKKKSAASLPPNPYFDFWAWSCRSLEWCGPCPESEARPHSHHVLPIFMHHFGCVVPSYESLEVLRAVADGRTVVDMGSGNGYWAFMLRQHGVDVAPVDNAQSEWRVSWVDDTVIMDGARWLSQGKNAGGKDMVLLMVYPVVGGGVGGGVEGGFTRGLMDAYKGDTVAVVGTQNRNGYTSFRDMTFDEYMEREQPGWTKVVQIPVPSFAGKDEALYVYQRGERAMTLKADEASKK
ncbi:hypothetical protein VPNG_08827 [Cytospora leucostoma]|uniref:Methyltransferase domain-containing protein n=1 Tax=Cytospora leucostoma TaxID=1230097 RepID=A0A423W1E4_9PEZI|nr:hypothetical protein VPNG_08827 [Cytospora leucostoma]